MLKKFSALFVLAVFLLSMVPMAFAEEQVRTRERVQVTETVTESTPVPVQIRQEVREVIREGRENDTPLREVRAEIKETVRARLADAPVRVKRMIAKEDLVRMKNQYLSAKEHFLSAKERYLKQKTTFVRAKEEYKECKGSDTDKCLQKREQIREQAQPHLLNAADLVLKELERVRAQAEASEDLTDEEITDILAELDERIVEVEDAKAVIEALGEDSTNAEINEAAKTIREAWQHTKVALKRHSGMIVNARLGNIIQKVEVLEKRLYNARDKLEEKGADVSGLDGKLADFSADLDTAAEKYLEARRMWSGANTPGEVDDVTQDVHALMKEAQAALKDAQTALRDIVREIKQLNKGSLEVAGDDSEDESEDTEETEIEEEEETEENEDACAADSDCDEDEFCDEGECEDLEEESGDDEDDESEDDSEEEESEEE